MKSNENSFFTGKLANVQINTTVIVDLLCTSQFYVFWNWIGNSLDLGIGIRNVGWRPKQKVLVYFFYQNEIATLVKKRCLKETRGLPQQYKDVVF